MSVIRATLVFGCSYSHSFKDSNRSIKRYRLFYAAELIWADINRITEKYGTRQWRGKMYDRVKNWLKRRKERL